MPQATPNTMYAESGPYVFGLKDGEGISGEKKNTSTHT